MNYELAKQLKDAGFPQNDNGAKTQGLPLILHEGQYTKRAGLYFTDGNYQVLVPTLSELIESLGIKFGKLHHLMIDGIEDWHAYSSQIENDINVPAYIVQNGPTPEEAVANLYLTLHEKKK